MQPQCDVEACFFRTLQALGRRRWSLPLADVVIAGILVCGAAWLEAVVGCFVPAFCLPPPTKRRLSSRQPPPPFFTLRCRYSSTAVMATIKGPGQPKTYDGMSPSVLASPHHPPASGFRSCREGGAERCMSWR